MESLPHLQFSKLFEAVCKKCFGASPSEPLSEAESKLLSNVIEEKTGLVVGWKSLKNYSLSVYGETQHKKENPSIATLDTLVRYVHEAPKTDEFTRKRDESHYPYWFKYREQYVALDNLAGQQLKYIHRSPINKILIFTASTTLLVLLLIIVFYKTFCKKPDLFLEEFGDVSEKILTSKEWYIKNKSDSFWERRNTIKDHLTLFTLKGDNIKSDSAKDSTIKNLLFRKLYDDNFSAEVHFTEFVPKQNWQQAGLLLMEDSTFESRSVRMSISYNNFFGGYQKKPEMNIQIIANLSESLAKPEEIIQQPIFVLDHKADSLISNNLRKSALRIEKREGKYRFLFSSGSQNLFAFKEIINKEIPITPKYIAIYASSGNSQNVSILPVYIDKFLLLPLADE